MNHLNRIIVENTIIHETEEVSISVGNTFDTSIIALLQETVYGTKGPKYQHTGQELKLQNLKNPLFFKLQKQDKMIGFYCLCEREVRAGNEHFLGYYGRYLAVDKNHQGNNYGKLLKKVAVGYVEFHSTSPSVLYSYIEENNTRSFNISQKLGFSSVTTLETIIFSRLYPKADRRVSRINGQELNEVLENLEMQNARTILRTFENINYQNNYFVIKQNGRIVAGLQANPVRWKIRSMEGIGGKIMLKVLPHIPILKRLINPDKYDFLAIEGLYVKPGLEDCLYPLIEGVLNHFSMSSALFQLDSKSQYLQVFKEKKQLGLLNAIKKEVKTHVMIKTLNVGDSSIIEGEAYISSFDFT